MSPVGPGWARGEAVWDTKYRAKAEDALGSAFKDKDNQSFIVDLRLA